MLCVVASLRCVPGDTMPAIAEVKRQNQQPNKIAIASNSTRARPDNYKLDDLLLMQALQGRGAEVYIIDWRNPNIRPTEFDTVVLRSTWDCHKYPDSFLAWLEEAGDRLVNSVDVVRWNYAKEQYLYELGMEFPTQVVRSNFYSKARRGIPFEDEVEPSRILADCKRKWGCSQLVLKPTISAEGDDTYCFNVEDEHQSVAAQAKLEEMLRANQGVIVQPMLEGINHGEYSLVYIGGEFTHAVKKPGGFKNSSEMKRQGIDEEELGPKKALADRIIAYTIQQKGWLAYARVDLVEENGPVLLELELGEPNLQLVRIPETCYKDNVHPTLEDIKAGSARQHQVIDKFVESILTFAMRRKALKEGGREP